MTRPDPLAGTPYFAFGRRPFREEHLSAYIRREHAKGRRVTEILADPAIERLGGTGLAWRVLQQPETIDALEHDTAHAIDSHAPELKAPRQTAPRSLTDNQADGRIS